MIVSVSGLLCLKIYFVFLNEYIKQFRDLQLGQKWLGYLVVFQTCFEDRLKQNNAHMHEYISLYCILSCSKFNMNVYF